MTPEWLMPAYVGIALTLHIYVAYKVTRIARLFTEAGIQDFADLLLGALTESAMKVPAFILRAIQRAKTPEQEE